MPQEGSEQVPLSFWLCWEDWTLQTAWGCSVAFGPGGVTGAGMRTIELGVSCLLGSGPHQGGNGSLPKW